jgi:hypothetical protein
MNRRLLSLTLLLALSASARLARAEAVPDVTRTDMRPWFVLQTYGADFAGRPFQGEVFLYQGGTVVLEHSGGTGDLRTIRRGDGTPQQVKDLRRALADARFGRARGNCGQPAPDWVERYGLVTYDGGAPRARSFGGDYSSCQVELREGFDALCSYIWNVVGPSPEVCTPKL